MTAEEELRRFGFYIRPNVAGALRLYTRYGVLGGQMNPGDYAEVQLFAESPLMELVQRAFAERLGKTRGVAKSK
ncbi:MAG TPA: hypothetical protein VFA65_24505 [Bryobacteraceae bacterium]|nr:hypothetical protein [Bryobacteraceae bacterium]